LAAPARHATHRFDLEIFEVVPDGVVVIDSAWRFSYANGRALELVGGGPVVGHNIFELFPGNRAEPFGPSYRRTMEQRVPTEFEAFQGAPLHAWFKVQAKPFEDGIVIFFSNVTERRLAELRGQEAASRLAQMLEATTDAVVMVDRDWRYTFLNSKAQRLLNDTDGSLLGNRCWEMFPDLAETSAGVLLKQTMAEQRSGSTEVYYPAPLDAWLHVECEPTPDGLVIFFQDITEEKQRRAALAEQQALLQAVQALAGLATWEVELASGRTTWGAGSFEVLGHPFEKVSHLDQLFETMLPSHRQKIRDEFDTGARTGEPMVMEYPVRTASGDVIWIESRGQRVRGTEASPRVRGMSIDITRRKLFEQNLVASEERYRVLADLNPQAIWMGDAQGRLTYANQGMMAYIGLTASDLGPVGWLEAFAPEHRARVVEVWTHSVKTGVDYDIEAPLWHVPSGTYRWWHLRAAPIRDATGEVLHWLGVGSDIHDMKTYAETLRAEQKETERRRAELETIYRTTPIGLSLLDPVEFRFLNLNDREAEMLGWLKEQLIGRPLREIAPPDKLPGLVEMMQTVAGGGQIKDRLLEGELSARPGEMRAWRVNFSPIFNEDGSVRAISSAWIEITNQKKAEAALIQSEKLAAVGRLASSISHEINNPLEAITNLLYLMGMEESLSPDVKNLVHLAQSECSRVSQIATQTLRFHRQAVAPTRVNAEELVGAVIRLYTGRLSNSDIRVETHYTSTSRIQCFENDIRQVLNNLIANAIDAMRNGGRIVVRAHDAAARGGRPQGVRITIADTGHGMSKDVQARIFEPFFTTKDLNGTGLGLWISHGIIERHKGRLQVRSSNNPDRHGTVFTLFLPCVAHPSPASEHI
jgi:PAS domain S-box-containing protein